MADGSDLQKQSAAASAVTRVESGMIVGLGTGSTAELALRALAKRVQEGLRITGIPTSERTAKLARELGIPLADWDERSRIDLTIDGADEVELGTLHLIKGRGGALLREKIVACASHRLIVVADHTKLVERLGRGSVPVEVVPFGWQATARRLVELGMNPDLRKAAGGAAFVTDGGHYILDCACGPILAPESLGEALDGVVGVVEHGLFLGMATEVHVGELGGIRVLSRSG